MLRSNCHFQYACYEILLMFNQIFLFLPFFSLSLTFLTRIEEAEIMCIHEFRSIFSSVLLLLALLLPLLTILIRVISWKHRLTTSVNHSNSYSFIKFFLLFLVTLTHKITQSMRLTIVIIFDILQFIRRRNDAHTRTSIFSVQRNDQPVDWLIYADDIFDGHNNHKKVMIFFCGTVRHTKFR